MSTEIIQKPMDSKEMKALAKKATHFVLSEICSYAENLQAIAMFAKGVDSKGDEDNGISKPLRLKAMEMLQHEHHNMMNFELKNPQNDSANVSDMTEEQLDSLIDKAKDVESKNKIIEADFT